jgi:hypothetical protein
LTPRRAAALRLERVARADAADWLAARLGAAAVTLRPGGESVALGRADFHGRWAEWSARAPSPRLR